MVILLCCNANILSAASFTGLGGLPGGHQRSFATDISGDGRVVVGYSHNGDDYFPFRWTEANGMEGDFNVGDWGADYALALSTSYDGSIIVGYSVGSYNWLSLGNVAFYWNENGEMQDLGYSERPSAAARDVSADGAIVVGYSLVSEGAEAFRWDSVNGMVGLGDLPGGRHISDAFAISGDGHTIVGYSWTDNAQDEAFRWTQEEGMKSLGDLPGGAFYSQAHDVSYDGKVIVGVSASGESGSDYGVGEAFRWTQEEGMQGLGDLLGGGFNSKAFAVSADGDAVVGYSHGEAAGGAFIWTPTNGMQSIRDLLISHGLADELEGWNLYEATGVSSDGKTVVGNGRNPSGNYEAWIATLIPSTNQAPTANAGPDQNLACEGPLTTVVLDGSGSSDPDSQGSLDFEWSSSIIGILAGAVVDANFTVGSHDITLKVSDGEFSSSNDLLVTIDDDQAPNISFSSSPVILEAVNAQGAAYVLAPVISDNCDDAVSVGVSPILNTYPIGKTAVTVTAFDDNGNSTEESIDVIVQDTTPPILQVLNNISVESTSSGGAIVGYGLPIAFDAVDASPGVGCTPGSGTLFPLGSTVVTCNAFDDSGNSVSSGFLVSVIDSTPPVLSGLTDLVVEATSPEGGVVNYASPTAIDMVDGVVLVDCDIPSGSLFSLGATTVNCSASDSSGNTVSGGFLVNVVDTTPPVFTSLPLSDVFVVTTSSGVVVDYVLPTVQDAVDMNPVVSCVPVSGSLFPLGSTTVSCSVSDFSGNISLTESFVVEVEELLIAIEDHLKSLIETIESFPSNSFKNGNRVVPLVNKLNNIIAMVNVGLYADALDQLKTDSLPKVDGCQVDGAGAAVLGTAQKDDWIQDCNGQVVVRNKVHEIIVLMEML